MTQEERRRFLIEYLVREQKQILATGIPEDAQAQRQLLRSLMNVRMPDPIGEDFLNVQDAYLKERNQERGITEADTLTPVPSDERLFLWQGDITTLQCDAIVNACNSQMLGCFQPMHGCIDNFIHTYAGVQLRLKMNEMMQAQGHEEPTGETKITPGYNLPCKYVLHTVGPIVSGVLTKRHEELLASCYKSCLNLANENGVKSIAFCCLSTGVFMFPNQRAAEIAVETVRDWLDETDSQMRVIFNVFKDVDHKIYKNILDFQ